MNGIHLDVCGITNIDPHENLFELRDQIYDGLLDSIFRHIDGLYERTANDTKIKDIEARSIKSKINKESLLMFYKGVEIPLIDKTCLIFDGIQYVPIFQMVDKPIHLQKDGKFIVVKNNIRNTFLKLDGQKSYVLTKNAKMPLLTYLLYEYDSVTEMLTDLGFTIVEDFSMEDVINHPDDFFIVPEYFENRFLIVRNDFEPGGWKSYFLSVFTVADFDFHQGICNKILDQINSDMIPQVLEGGELDSSILTDVKHTSDLDEQIKENRKRRENLDIKNTREYILLQHKDEEVDQRLVKIFNVINTYHTATRTTKRSLTKVFLSTNLYKFHCEDITMNNISVFGMLIDHIKANTEIPLCYNLADISQKDLRFMEWLALRLSSVSSYPEQNIIIEVAKTEQKKIYNNSVNPITELCMMSRVNLFGKGAIPLEACNAKIRNVHDSYMGVVDPIDSASGTHVGISLHLIPEVGVMDIEANVKKLKNGNVISIMYDKQNKVEETQV